MTLHWTYKIALTVHTRKLTISCFTFTHRWTIHHKLSNSYQIPSLKDCRKVLLTKKVFNTAKAEYEDALKKSDYNADMKYTDNKSEKPKTRKRNIIWFNPPFSKSVSTNVAKTFLQLVTKHFPRSHKLHKIFNRNTVKVSYSCMNNMSNIIKGHNKKSSRNHMTKDQNAIAEKKQNVQWKGTVKLTT